MVALDTALGVLYLAGYITLIVSLAAGITYAVIRIFPTERNPKKPDKPDKPDASSGNGGSTPAGSLYRRAKRGLTN